MLNADAKATGISIAAAKWTEKLETQCPESTLPKTASLKNGFGVVK